MLMPVTTDGQDGQNGQDQGSAGNAPSDLISTSEALRRWHLGYPTLFGWWQRGVIRRWKRGQYNYVSASEVARAVDQYRVLREILPPYPNKKTGEGEAGAPPSSS